MQTTKHSRCYYAAVLHTRNKLPTVQSPAVLWFATIQLSYWPYAPLRKGQRLRLIPNCLRTVLAWATWGQGLHAHTTIVAATTKCDGPRCVARCQLFWGKACTALTRTVSNQNIVCLNTTCPSLAACSHADAVEVLLQCHSYVPGHGSRPAARLTHSCMAYISILTFSKQCSPSS
ncbi:hypothetical protein C7974DRAFT_386855 [Boeremia exigua]|uniref:uncharacterized protein n=1 Tax=Boeremia exigua TaxID=749465 RepID=UPI001E8E3AE0|nr:uncharacterized protein C7974DRAFT_386855 [Boeremia exigua]KAH6643133.1 hypothetical protein C7974DRAFT_386855 [Boeremia exigua]